MTRVKLAETAILKLNEVKKTDIKIISIKDEGHFVHVIIRYPKSVADQTFGFTTDWFDPRNLHVEGHSWLTGFTVPDKLRRANPDAVVILRIAYYFWRYGLGGRYI